MKIKIISIISIVSLLTFFSGCTSPSGLKLSQAMINSLNIESAQSDSEISLNISGDNLGATEQEQQVLNLINSSTIKFNSKSDIKNNKSNISTSIDLSGLSVTGNVYSDQNKLWFKLPTEPKYIKFDPAQMITSDEEKEAMQASIAMQQKIKPLAIKFAKDFISNYKYTFNDIKNTGTTTIKTPEGEKEVTNIEVKLNDKESQSLIDYTFKNLASSDALKEYIKSAFKLSIDSIDSSKLDAYNSEEMDAQIDEAFNQIKTYVDLNSQEIVSSISSILKVDTDGITFSYGIDKDNNIVSTNSKINLMFINPDDSSQKLNIKLNANSTIYNINKTTVDFPKFTSSNTLSAKEYVKRNQSLKNSSVGEAFGVESKHISLTIDENIAYKNDSMKFLDSAPYIENDSTLVPVRFVGESLGSKIDWVSSTKSIICTDPDTNKTIKMQIGNKIAYVNGKPVEMSVAPVINNDSTMIPVRFVSEQFGAEVQWIEETRTILIDKE